MKSCPNCGSVLDESVIACPHCSYDFAQATPAAASAPVQPVGPQAKCPHCGHALASSLVRLCPACRTPLIKSAVAAPPPQNKMPQPSVSAGPTPGLRPPTPRPQMAGTRHAQIAQDAAKVRLSLKQIIGFIGAMMLLLGIFLPIAKIPVFGSINYWQVSTTIRSTEHLIDATEKMKKENGGGGMLPGMSDGMSPGMGSPGMTSTPSMPDASNEQKSPKIPHDFSYFAIVYGPMLLLAMAIISIYLVSSDLCIGLFATGGISLGLMGYLVFAAIDAMKTLTASMKSDGSSMIDPMIKSLFDGKSLADLFGIHWLGIITLLLAAIILVVGAAIPSQTTD